MSRPKNRSIRKVYRLNKKEAEILARKAEQTCLCEADLVRFLLAGYEPREAPPKEFYDSLNELRSIGNSLNQIAAKAHTLGYIDTPKLDDALRRLYIFEADIEDTYLLPERSSD